MTRKPTLPDALAAVKDRIAAAAALARHEPSDISLIAVTKYAAPEQIRELLTLGVADVAENKVQQLQQRAALINEFHARQLSRGADATIAPRIRWHMIGHLQRNKVKPLLPLVTLIHSIDSLRLAEEIDAQAEKLGKKVNVMIQVNGSEEPQKSGVAIGAASHLGEQIATMPGIQLVGLMTMAAYGAAEKELRSTFSRVREVFEEMKWLKIGGSAFRHLSMGMSDDFEPAIEEGSTMVRIGSALFGPRPDNAPEETDED